MAMVGVVVLLVIATVVGTTWWVHHQERDPSAGGVSGSAGHTDAEPSQSSASVQPSTAPVTTPTPPTPLTTSTPSTSTTAAPTFAETYQDVESGVLRILATTCDGDGIGTGFLLGPTLVATAAHVVNGAEAVSIDGPNGIESAQVVGINASSDLALLRLSHPVPGHIFRFASTDASPGTTVAAIGFPLNEPKTLTIGTVSGLDRTIRIDGVARSGLLQTDTAINPGNSGGPLVTAQGEVVGVVDALRLHSQGIGYAVQGSVARPALLQRQAMLAPSPPTCGLTEAPSELTVTPQLIPPADPVSVQIQQTLSTYYNAINVGDYKLVIRQFSPSFGGNFNPVEMSRTLATSIDFDAVIHTTDQSGSSPRAWVTFVSVQAARYGPDGETCTEWSLDYDFVESGESVLIDGVQAHSGDGHIPC